MSRADVWNYGAVLWGEPGEEGTYEQALLVHVDKGGSIVIQQEERYIVANRESLLELIVELQRVWKQVMNAPYCRGTK